MIRHKAYSGMISVHNNTKADINCAAREENTLFTLSSSSSHITTHMTARNSAALSMAPDDQHMTIHKVYISIIIITGKLIYLTQVNNAFIIMKHRPGYDRCKQCNPDQHLKYTCIIIIDRNKYDRNTDLTQIVTIVTV